MGDRYSYRLIGLIVAIAAYIAILAAVYYVVYEDAQKKKDYGFNVEDAIVVDIDTLVKTKPRIVEKPEPKKVQSQRAVPFTPPKPAPKPAPRQIEKPQPKPEPKAPQPIKEETKPSQKVQESRDKMAKSAKDLFSTVRTDKYAKALEEKRKQEAARASRLKKQKAKEARKKAEAKKREEARRKRQQQRRAQALLEALEQQKSSSAKQLKKGEEDQFWSFVSNKIMAKWNRTIATQDGLKGYATIRIDNRGRLSYKNLKLSGNSLFDTKLKVFLDNLEYVRFPAYKDGPYIEAVFEFKDQVKGK